MKEILQAGPSITKVEKSYVKKMMNDGWDNYKYVEEFEEKFARWHNRKFCLMTPNCTQAIHLILMSLNIKEGDEVIVPELTWTATAAPIIYQKAKPVFVDVDEKTWCISIDSIQKNITNKTKAIIFVDLYGNMPNIDQLKKLSKKTKIPLIEDSAEALGSKYKGIRAGKFGIGSVHSFHRTKTITTGEGGALLIDNKKIYQRAKFLRDHGRSNKIPYFTLEATPKYMPSNIQGALALGQFKRINELIKMKRSFMNFYKSKFKNLDVILNYEDKHYYNGVWATSMVFSKKYKFNKLDIINSMQQKKIPIRPFFYPLSSLPAYKKYNNKNKMKNPIAYDISKRGITLPCHYNLKKEQLEHIANSLINFFNQ